MYIYTYIYVQGVLGVKANNLGSNSKADKKVIYIYIYIYMGQIRNGSVIMSF